MVKMSRYNDIPFIPSEILNTKHLLDLLPLPNASIHLDIGTGLGHFLEEMAQRFPAENWFGLEFDGKTLKRAVRRVRRTVPQNARLLAMKARPFLLEAVPPNSLHHIWLNFPDPWHKKRHANRRHTSLWMLGLLASRLRVGGELHLATDVPAYLETMAAGMAQCAGMTAVTETPWQRETLGVQTKYERKWLRQGKPIFYGDWRKTGEGEAYPFEWSPAPDLPAVVLPEAGVYGEGRFTAKVFPPRRYAPHQAGFYLIDHEQNISTPGYFDEQSGTVSIKGAWTPWKIALLRKIMAETR